VSTTRDLLLRDRRYLTLLSARTLSMLAISFAPVALAFGILDLPGATATTLSLVLASESAAIVIFTLAGGVIADRYPRHRVLQVAEWTAGVVHAVLGLMILTHHAPTAALAAVAFLGGTGSALVWPALTGIVPDVVPVGSLQEGNALLGLGGNIARVAGLVTGGIVVVAIGPGWALLAAAATFACSGLLVSLLKLTRSERPKTTTSIIAELRDGWDEFRSRQWLWVCVVQFSVLVMVWEASHLVLGPVVAKAELGGPAAWTKVLTGESIGLVLGGLVSIRWRPRRPVLVVAVFSLGAVPTPLLLGLSAPLVAVIAAAFVLGFSFELLTVIWQTTMQREIPPSSLSRVSSYDALGSLLLGPVGLVLAGPVSIAIGTHRALLVCAGIMAATMVFAVSFPGIRNLRAPYAAPASVVP
jgi:MFS family permease